MILPTISTAKCGANAHTAVPAVNRHIAVKNNARVVNFSMRNAVIGIMMPFTSMNIVVSHCAEFAVTSKYRINDGKAVFNNVWFKMTTKAPDTKTVRTTLRLTGGAVSGDGVSALAKRYFLSEIDPFASRYDHPGRIAAIGSRGAARRGENHRFACQQCRWAVQPRTLQGYR